MTYKNTIEKIRSAQDSRIIPSRTPGKVHIVIQEGGNWVKIMRDVSQQVAEDTLRQAKDRLLLG